ncbi:hypothetical protein COCOR_02857 [Corallococcus coralloides DSM 2259]|uniref:Uncharacterized protein n=1 Tax=Corallococcus coralloides (strain ATCC 25202 / DSM 2259 / NBRC 100086 / M2) TaxID=1144275 RepID=H8MX65_CORCM|nr:hypothetical protein [Corallococcus coralloides]AFE04873.1 hypothetical protein COCOR_02857 [Corallococcus coralloides DSM 2259]
MRATALTHAVQWVAASPLWGPAADTLARIQAPGLLQFDSDRFMEELAERLQQQPRPDLTDLLVTKFESFGERMPGEDPVDPNRTPKLYQPAHGRFYLLASSLVCRLPGMPDHVVDTAKGEKAAFVLRQELGGGKEGAWVPDASDPRGKRRIWKVLEAAGAGALAKGEELLPLFPVNFTADGKRRRMLVGLVPTSSRDTFESAAAFQDDGSSVDPEQMVAGEAETQVVVPYEQLRLWSADSADAEVQKEVSRFLLVDLATLLKERLEALWKLLDRDSPGPAPTDASLTLFNLLVGRHVEGTGGDTWRQALRSAMRQREAILNGRPNTVNYNLRLCTEVAVTELRQALAQAAKVGTYALPSQPEPVSKLEAPGVTRYVLRCVYLKPACGAMSPPLVSPRSRAFTLAPFFDPDAPARPVRIELPVDTSIRGLRRFKKNVGFTLSRGLRKQMSRVAGLEKTMKGELDEGLSFELGELCMFSIPIITLCAFIVLMMLLALLNIIFWWMPFLKICLPKPRVG